MSLWWWRGARWLKTSDQKGLKMFSEAVHRKPRLGTGFALLIRKGEELPMKTATHVVRMGTLMEEDLGW